MILQNLSDWLFNEYVLLFLGLISFGIPFFWSIRKPTEQNKLGKLNRFGFLFLFFTLLTFIFEIGKNRKSEKKATTQRKNELAAKDSIIANQELQIEFLSEINFAQNNISKAVNQLESLNQEISNKSNALLASIEYTSEELKKSQNPISKNISYEIQLSIEIDSSYQYLLDSLPSLTRVEQSKLLAKHYFDLFDLFFLNFEIFSDEKERIILLSSNNPIDLYENFDYYFISHHKTNDAVLFKYFKQNNKINLTFKNFTFEKKFNKSDFYSLDDICNHLARINFYMRSKSNRKEKLIVDNLFTKSTLKLKSIQVMNANGRSLKFTSGWEQESKYFWNNNIAKNECWK